MPLTTAPATIGAQGFDADSVIDADTAKALAAAGFGFAVRYLSRTTPQNNGDLSAAEIGWITDAGLALMAVQHCPLPGWAPTLALGTQYGTAAAVNAAAIGLPQGVAVWLDLEGVAPYATAADTIAYCNTWAGVVAQAGFMPGLYVGANQPLTSDELYWRLKVAYYWKSASRVPDIPVRGYCMIQALAPSPIDGISLDRNAVQLETMQTLLPIWAVATEPAVFP
jgi:hypothetical protein